MSKLLSPSGTDTDRGIRLHGPTVREKRKIVGWSQQELANRCDVTRQTIGHAEASKSISLELAKEIASALACTINELATPIARQEKETHALNGTPENGVTLPVSANGTVSTYYLENATIQVRRGDSDCRIVEVILSEANLSEMTEENQSRIELAFAKALQITALDASLRAKFSGSVHLLYELPTVESAKKLRDLIQAGEFLDLGIDGVNLWNSVEEATAGVEILLAPDDFSFCVHHEKDSKDLVLRTVKPTSWHKYVFIAAFVIAGLASVCAYLLSTPATIASDAYLKLPDLHGSVENPHFKIFNQPVSAWNLLFYGALVICGTLGISLFQLWQIHRQPAHKSMLDVAEVIFQTCKTYLIQQGKFLILVFAFIAVAIAFYFYLGRKPTDTMAHTLETVGLVLLFSIVGMAGSYAVAWYGIRVNTYANARTAFASLKGEPWDVVNLPLRAGMSIGLFLISLELIMMVIILLFVPRQVAGVCFLGFAIGESLGSSALRIAGGIFTKIADIGSDIMKIVFNVKEDDPRNPGIIADCTGDNAGDSVGPTADGFETYGVTGVALISFICLAVPTEFIQAKLIVWIFAMRFLMDFMSGASYFINQAISEKKYRGLKEFDFEEPLTRLIWIASILCISTSFGMSYLLIGDMPAGLWWKLATIISCGTLAAVLIPEFTKVFTSSHSKHVHEIVTASRKGGASLTILSGLVAGNFSAFWKGILIAGLMAVAYAVSLEGVGEELLGTHAKYAPIFAFGLVAFGFLCMGPVNIAVDSYGPVTDNAQSVFELAQTEHIPGIKEEIKRDFGFDANFEQGKHYLEANDSAGNTFKATAKPVLIGTAVVGATTMIFSIILILEKTMLHDSTGKLVSMLQVSLTDAPVLLGLICGGAVIYWFCGASMQAVTTGAYRAVEYIKKNLDLSKKEADIEDSKTVVRICTEYAQSGMWNIFIALMCFTLAFALFNPNFFVAYLISIAVFGLFQAIYMATAGGLWDNAKKYVEVDLRERKTPVHSAVLVGDTVGDPFKDTTSVALNPIIKFSTLFGLLAVEIAISVKVAVDKKEIPFDYTWVFGSVLVAVALVFVWRSFYATRNNRAIRKPIPGPPVPSA